MNLELKILRNVVYIRLQNRCGSLILRDGGGWSVCYCLFVFRHLKNQNFIVQLLYLTANGIARYMYVSISVRPANH